MSAHALDSRRSAVLSVAALDELKAAVHTTELLVSAEDRDHMGGVERLAANAVEPDAPYPLTLLKRAEFGYKQARDRVLRMRLMASAGDAGDAGTPAKRLLRLMSTAVDMDDRPAVRACGALLSYLAGSRVINQLEDAAAPLVVRDYQPLPSRDAVACDYATRRTLAVFASDRLGGAARRA